MDLWGTDSCAKFQCFNSQWGRIVWLNFSLRDLWTQFCLCMIISIHYWHVLKAWDVCLKTQRQDEVSWFPHHRSSFHLLWLWFNFSFGGESFEFILKYNLLDHVFQCADTAILTVWEVDYYQVYLLFLWFLFNFD